MISMLLSIAAAPAGARKAASGPPHGHYTCTIGAYQQVAGTLRIFTKHRYTFRKSAIGRFATHGKRMTFTSGTFHGKFSGRWHRTSSGKAEVLLTKKGKKSASEFCDRA
jgi:hypothetical protein